MKLIGPFQCLPFAKTPLKGALESLEIISDAGLLFSDGKIVEVGNFKELEKRADEVITLEGSYVCLPGFIDCHTHICFAGSRAGEYAQKLAGATYIEIATAGGGILSTVKATREASEEVLRELTFQRLEEKLLQGITTCEIKSGYGLTWNTEVKMLRAIRSAGKKSAVDVISTCLAAHILPPEAESKKVYLDYMAEELLPELKSSNLTSRVDIFVEETAFSADDAIDYLNKAKELGFDVTVHADQFSCSGSEVALQVGALSADHLEATTPELIGKLQKSDTISVVLPGASLGLGIPFAPARKMLDAGCAVAIASDHNPGSAPMGDLLTQALIMGMYEKLTAAETFAAITFRAAAALGLSDRGRLSKNMRADFVLFKAEDYSEILWRQGALKPSNVYSQGEEVYVAR